MLQISNVYRCIAAGALTEGLVATIVAADTFVDNGGDFNTMEIDGESKEVDWSMPKSVEAWLDSPYQGDTSVRNGTQLEAIREYFLRGYVASSDYPAGLSGINGWNVDGTLD